MNERPTTTRQFWRPRRIALALLALLLGATATWLACRWTFVVRLWTYPYEAPTTTVDWYRPVEPIPGDDTAQPIATESPARLGLSLTALEAAADWADRHNTTAFLVARAGRIAFERYWRGGSATTPTISHSMAKTLLALLVGIAIERGEIAGLDEPIGELLAEWRTDSRGAITLRQLLTMTSGLEGDSLEDGWLPPMARLHLETDLLPTLLAHPATGPPGVVFDYNNFNSQLVGLALERATGQRYAELLSRRLWQPIGARDAGIWLDRPAGNAKIYGAVIATARDWLRIGELVRLRGRAHGVQIVPRAWFETIERPSALQAEYGVHIWLGGGPPTDLPRYVYLDGKSKQRVFVVRSHEIVIVRTGENARGWRDDELVALVLAAVER